MIKTTLTTNDMLENVFGYEAFKVVSENIQHVIVQTKSMVNFKDLDNAECGGLKFYQVHATTDIKDFAIVLEFVFMKVGMDQ